MPKTKEENKQAAEKYFKTNKQGYTGMFAGTDPRKAATSGELGAANRAFKQSVKEGTQQRDWGYSGPQFNSAQMERFMQYKTADQYSLPMLDDTQFNSMIQGTQYQGWTRQRFMDLMQIAPTVDAANQAGGAGAGSGVPTLEDIQAGKAYDPNSVEAYRLNPEQMAELRAKSQQTWLGKGLTSIWRGIFGDDFANAQQAAGEDIANDIFAMGSKWLADINKETTAATLAAQKEALAESATQLSEKSSQNMAALQSGEMTADKLLSVAGEAASGTLDLASKAAGTYGEAWNAGTPKVAQAVGGDFGKEAALAFGRIIKGFSATVGVGVYGLGSLANFSERELSVIANRLGFSATGQKLTDLEAYQAGKLGWSRNILTSFAAKAVDENLKEVGRALSGKEFSVLVPIPAGVGTQFLQRAGNRESVVSSAMTWATTNPARVEAVFLQRYRNGEDPNLLALELQDPGAELLGQLVVDPLNLLDAPLDAALESWRLTRAASAFSLGDTAAKALKTTAQVVGDVDAGINAKRIVSAFDTAQDMARLTDKVATPALLEARKTIRSYVDAVVPLVNEGWQAMKGIASPKGVWDAARAGNTWKAGFGLFSLQSSGQINKARKSLWYVTATLYKDVYQKVGPEQCAKVMASLLGISRGGDNIDPMTYNKMIEIVSSSPAAKVLLTEGGLQGAKMLDEAIGNADDLVKIFKKADGSILSIVDALSKKADDVFPSLAKRIKYQEEITDLVKAGKEIPENLKPWVGDTTVPDAIKGIVKVHTGIQENQAVRWVATGFRRMYITANYAQAFKNHLTNMITLGLFQGPESVAKYFTDTKKMVEEMGGLGFLNIGAVEGFGMSAQKGLNIVEGAAKAPSTGIKGALERIIPGTLSSNWEQQAGVIASYNAIMPAWKEMVKQGRVLGDPAPFLRAGFSMDEFKTLGGLVERTGSAKKAIELLKSGGKDVLSLTNLLDVDQAKALRQMGVYHYVEEMLTTADSASLPSRMTELKSTIFDSLVSAFAEESQYTVEEMALFKKLFPDFEVLDGADSLFMRNWKQYHNCDRAMNRMIRNRSNVIDTALSPLVNRGEITFENYKQLIGPVRNREGKVLDDIAKSKKFATDEAMRLKGISDAGEMSSAEYYAAKDKVYRAERNNQYKLFKEYYRDIDDILGQYKAAGQLDLRTIEDMQDSILTSLALDLADNDYFKATREVGMQKHPILNLLSKYNVFPGSDITNKTYSLSTIFKRLGAAPSGDEKSMFDVYERWAQGKISPEELARAEKKAMTYGEKAAENQQPFRLLVDLAEEEVATPTRAKLESMGGFERFLDDLSTKMSSAIDNVKPVKEYTSDQLKIMEDWAIQTERRIAEARPGLIAYGDAVRKFCLNDYADRRGFDALLSYIYPFHFWYSRSYPMWAVHLATHPGQAAAYAKYKDYMQRIHAGMPDWWKYNINANELLGLNMENPLLFNLEQTLNPINGLTGIDFDDSRKRNDAFGSLLDSAGKMGPSVWTPYTLGYGLIRYLQGDTESGGAWMSRLAPQTQLVKGLTSIVGIGGPGGVETDPVILLNSLAQGDKSGIGGFEKNRVGRMVGEMMTRDIDGMGTITQDQAVDAVYAQTGDIWNRAWKAVAQRDAPGQVLSSVLGAGFKTRSPQDMQIDNFYNEMFSLVTRKPDLAPAEYQQAWINLEKQYPFATMLLLSRKTGRAKDEALAWFVLGKIPPGMSTDYATASGIDTRLLDKFYSSKGDTSSWEDTERNRFMDGMIDMGAVLGTPSDTLRDEWDMARQKYGKIKSVLPTQYTQAEEYYYSLSDDPARMNKFLADNPLFSKYMDLKQYVIMSDPTLFKYYGGIKFVESMIKRQYRTQAETKWPGISDKMETYLLIKQQGGNTANFVNDYPELQEYFDFMQGADAEIAARLEEQSTKFPESPAAIIRPDYLDRTLAQQDLLKFMRENAPTDGKNEALASAYVAGERSEADFSIGSWIEKESEKRWPGIGKKVDRFNELSVTDPQAAAAFILANPDVAAYRNWAKNQRNQYNAMQQPDYNPALPMDWEAWKPEFPDYLSRQVDYYIATGKELPDATRKSMIRRWTALGKPFGTFDYWLSVMVNPETPIQ